MSESLEQLYQQAQSALKARDYDRASDLLKQILVIDEDYKDASRLLAQAVKLKRRRWYSHPVLWSVLGLAMVIGLGIWLAPRIALPAGLVPTATFLPFPAITFTPTLTIIPSEAPTLTPTPIPLAWKRISMGLEFPRDTIVSILVDPQDMDVIYAGMRNAGVYKSIDGGNSWTPASKGLQNTHIVSLLMDPSAPNVLYAGTIKGIYKSEDGGQSWEKAGDGSRLAMDPQNFSHLYAYYEWNWGPLYETSNGGRSWEFYDFNCPSLWSWAIDPQDGKTLYGRSVFDDCIGVFKSTDNGRSWQEIGLQDEDIYSIAVAKDEKGNSVVYAGGYQSTDGGKNWSSSDAGWCDYLPANPATPDTVYCTNETGIVIIKPGVSSQMLDGLSFLDVSAFYSGESEQGTRMLAGGSKRDGSGESLYISTDNGKSWEEQSAGLGATRLELKIDPLDPARMYLAAYMLPSEQLCILYRSDDSGKNWKTIGQGDGWCGPSIDSSNALYFLGRGKNLLEKSVDGGDTWVSQQIQSDETFRYLYANPYRVGWLYGLADQPYYSTNAGLSWQKADKHTQDDGPIRKLYFAPEGNSVYAINAPEYSIDGGKTWDRCGDDPKASNSDSQLVIDPRNNKHLYLASMGNGILISNDGCASWDSSQTGLGNLFVNTIVMDPNNFNTLYAGTNNGAYVSFDGGLKWNEISDGLLGATVVYSIAVDKDSNVYAATPYGIFKLEAK